MGAILTWDKAAVIGVFESEGRPMFGIYEGNKLMKGCAEDGTERRLEILNSYLDLMQEAGTSANFEIRFYDEPNKKGKITSDLPYFGSLPFKFSESERQLAKIASGGAAGTANQSLMMDVFNAKMETLDLKWQHMLEKKQEEIDALEYELEEAKKGDPDEDLGSIGQIGKVTKMIGAAGEQYPWLQDTIKELMSTVSSLFSGAKTKFTSMTENARPVQMAGVPPKPQTNDLNEKLKWANHSIIAYFRNKHGCKVDANGAAMPGSEDAMMKADQEYVNTMCKLAEISASKPKTFGNALESLNEL